MKTTATAGHAGSLSTKRICTWHVFITALHQRGQADLAGYLERHQRQTQYLEFRQEGFQIVSGTVESGAKQFKQRLTGTGMRWNADRMLVIRAAVLGNDFDALSKVARLH